jgi:hypothetical protein
MMLITRVARLLAELLCQRALPVVTVLDPLPLSSLGQVRTGHHFGRDEQVGELARGVHTIIRTLATGFFAHVIGHMTWHAQFGSVVGPILVGKPIASLLGASKGGNGKREILEIVTCYIDRWTNGHARRFGRTWSRRWQCHQCGDWSTGDWSTGWLSCGRDIAGGG